MVTVNAEYAPEEQCMITCAVVCVVSCFPTLNAVLWVAYGPILYDMAQ